ncbi:hypothetical protein MBLNU457_6308t1 [Dothideomycetes sp. NU457]
MSEDMVVFQGRDRSTRTQRGRTIDSASSMNNDNNDPPPPYQKQSATTNAQSDRPAPPRQQAETAIQQPRSQTTRPSAVYWSRIGEYHSVKAPHWSHSLFAVKRYEAKRNKISRIDFSYGSSIARPKYYFSCHLMKVKQTSNFSIEHNLGRIVMLYLRHRKRYDCDCSLARLCLDLQPGHVQVHASTPQLDAAGHKHFLRTQSSSASSGCDFFEKERSWRDRRLAKKLTKALRKHSRQCTCQCFGAWATPQKSKRARVVPADEGRNLITLHRSDSSDCSKEWDDASGKVTTNTTRTSAKNTTRQDRKESRWGRFRRMLGRKKQSKADEGTSSTQADRGPSSTGLRAFPFGWNDI